MIPKECKRLAEVDFPIADVSRHAVGENPSRKGHPWKLHKWWARRPLASSRAVLMALLLPDPCDGHCPQAFKTHAREILLSMRTRPGGWNEQVKTDEGLRRVLLKFIADFANWDNSARTEYVETGRALVRAAHPEETPLVVDPFAGGGSIPFEALRFGCDAFASDLNPVACLILKMMLEDIPRHGSGLADELREAGTEIKARAEAELRDLYPTDADGATPISYLWARTVRCESPNCGAEIPLIRSFWLCNKPKLKWALQPIVEHPDEGPAQVGFELFKPERSSDVPGGLVANAKATCVCCGAVMRPERVRTQLTAQNGGADVIFDSKGKRVGGARMIAVVTKKPVQKERCYRLPTADDYRAILVAQERVAKIVEDWESGNKESLCPVPNEQLPLMSGTFNVPLYGVDTWGALFTARQKATLVELAGQIQRSGHSSPLRELLACALSVFVRACNGNARLRPDSSVAPAFGMQALPFTWTFPETVISGGRSENFDGALSSVAQVVQSFPSVSPGQMQQADAIDSPLPHQSASVWFTDPPYYFAIPYADLSDFFFVWLKRALPDHPLLQDPFDPANVLTPKEKELCEMAHWDSIRYSHKDQAFFEDGMAKAFAEGRKTLSEDGIGSVVFAHKTTAGWEALLSGMIRGGWTITGSWPIATENVSRLRARESAALATSVHLICRPRPHDAPVGDWGAVLRELPGRVAAWMQRLQSEGVKGADLVFACVGPALEIYSRYSTVETAEGQEVGLPEYLEKVWEVVGREALKRVLGTAEAQKRNGAAGALEEDSRLTALFLWTMQSTAASTLPGSGNGADNVPADAEESSPRKATNYSLPFDVVRRFAQPLGIHLDEWESRIIRTKQGVVRLLPVTERGTQLFGEAGADALADAFESNSAISPQLSLFPEEPPNVRGRARRRGRSTASTDDLEAKHGATTLDRVHAAMLLQASGRSQALRNLLRAEQERGPEFLRLANALTALYPPGSEEKRLLDAMLLAAPR